MEVMGHQCVTAVEARESIDKKRKTTLTYEQKIALDFLKKSTVLTKTDTKKLVEELNDLKMKDRVSAMIANILPKTKDDVSLILTKERTTLKEEDKDKILSIVKKYL